MDNNSNNTSFSKKDDDYHANEMINRIKKIKKTKKNKIQNNYKNIEVFDDLHDSNELNDNTENDYGNNNEYHDNTETNANETFFEGFIEGYDPGPYNGDYYVDTSGNVQHYDPTKPLDFEGMDEGDKQNTFDFQKYLSNLIEYLYACVYLVNYIIAYTIAVIFENESLAYNAEQAKNIINENKDAGKAITEGTTKIQRRMIDDFHKNKPFWFVEKPPNTSDVILIMKFLNWFESISISIFAVFNWYYIMFYEEKNKEGNYERIPISEFFYGNNMKCAASGTISQLYIPAELWYIINYFFLPSLFFLEHLQFFVKDLLPSVLKSICNQPLCFVIVFILLIFTIQNYAVVGKNNLIDIINGNTSNHLVKFMYFTIIMVLIMLIISGESNCNKDKLSKEQKESLAPDENPINAAIHTVEKLGLRVISLMLSPITSIVGVIVFFVLTVLRVTFSSIVCIPLAGLLCMGFILFYSFFAIFIKNPLNVFGKIKDILTFIREQDNIEKKKLDKTDKFFDKVLMVLIEIVEFFYNHCFHIAYLILFISTFVTFLDKFKSSSLKITLCTIIGAVILIILTYIYYGLLDLGNKYYRQMVDIGSNATSNVNNIVNSSMAEAVSSTLNEKSSLDQLNNSVNSLSIMENFGNVVSSTGIEKYPLTQLNNSVNSLSIMDNFGNPVNNINNINKAFSSTGIEKSPLTQLNKSVNSLSIMDMFDKK